MQAITDRAAVIPTVRGSENPAILRSEPADPATRRRKSVDFTACLLHRVSGR